MEQISIEKKKRKLHNDNEIVKRKMIDTQILESQPVFESDDESIAENRASLLHSQNVFPQLDNEDESNRYLTRTSPPSSPAASNASSSSHSEDYDSQRKNSIKLRNRPPGSSTNDIVSTESSEPSNGAEDKLLKCRQRSKHSVRFYKRENVWISRRELDFIRRWFKRPKEMTRRLLKELVGEENLINISALGRKTKANKRNGIPKDILRAVEDYVRAECTIFLSGQEFITCVNMMIASLRAQAKKGVVN